MKAKDELALQSGQAHSCVTMCTMRRLAVCSGLLFALASCAPKPINVDLRSVLDEAADNDLGPTSKLRAQKLLVGGIVERTGLKKQTELEGSGFAYGGAVTIETERVKRHYPYVVLIPWDKKQGRAMCFFELFEADDIAQLAVGDKVTFEGELQEFTKSNGQEVMVLHCKANRD